VTDRYTWFLKPVKRGFAHTNEVVSKVLASVTDTSSDHNAGTDIFMGNVCADGKRHNLYRCPSGLLFMLWSSRDTLKINFRVFCQEGKGKIRDKTRWYRHSTQGRPRAHLGLPYKNGCPCGSRCFFVLKIISALLKK